MGYPIYTGSGLDPRTAGLLGMASGLFQAGGVPQRGQRPVGLGQALGVGMQQGLLSYENAQKLQMEAQAMQQQEAMRRLQMEEIQRKRAAEEKALKDRQAIFDLLPPEFRLLAQLDPDTAAKTYAEQKFPKPQSGKEIPLDVALQKRDALPENHPNWKVWDNYIRKLSTHQPAPSASASASVGDSAYLKTRLTGIAKAMEDSQKSAEGAYLSNQALNRMEAVNEDAYEGALAPLFGSAANLVASITGADPSSLTSMTQFNQAVAEIKANYMRQLGARGLTDADMKILSESLPAVNTSKAARLNVIRILKKSNNFTIGQYKDKLDQELKAQPEMKGKQMRPDWLEFWSPEKGSMKAPSPKSVARLKMNRNNPKERAMFDEVYGEGAAAKALGE